MPLRFIIDRVRRESYVFPSPHTELPPLFCFVLKCIMFYVYVQYLYQLQQLNIKPFWVLPCDVTELRSRVRQAQFM